MGELQKNLQVEGLRTSQEQQDSLAVKPSDRVEIIAEIDTSKMSDKTILVLRSDSGYNKDMLAALWRRIPEGAMLLCLRPNEILETLDDVEMEKCGWIRKPLVITMSE